MNETSLMENRLELKDVWEMGIKPWGRHRYLSRYITLHHVMKHKPAAESVLQLTVNVTSYTKVFIYLHNKGQFLPSSSSFVGSDTFTVAPETYNPQYSGFSKILVIGKAFSRKIISTANLPKAPCNEDPNASLTNCYKLYVEQRVGCQIPIIGQLNRQRNCSGSKDELEYFNEAVRFLEMPNKKRIRETGCMPPCTYTEFQSKTIYKAKISRKMTGATLLLNFFSPQSIVPFEEEVLVYDGYNFIADVGGYLGLLLGVSVLTIYKDGIKWLRLQFNK